MLFVWHFETVCYVTFSIWYMFDDAEIATNPQKPQMMPFSLEHIKC